MPGGVFISYRREDSAGFAGRIYDRLTRRLDAKSVFLDVDNIQPGLDFFDVLSEKLRLCDALIAVIGKNWDAGADQDNPRRLDDPDDFVRIEIEAALERGIRVIPVLVDGATMPRREDLPESLQKLRRRQAIEISHSRFDSDVERLARVLEEDLRLAEEARREAELKTQEERRARESERAEHVAHDEGERREAVERELRESAGAALIEKAAVEPDLRTPPQRGRAGRWRVSFEFLTRNLSVRLTVGMLGAVAALLILVNITLPSHNFGVPPVAEVDKAAADKAAADKAAADKAAAEKAAAEKAAAEKAAADKAAADKAAADKAAAEKAAEQKALKLSASGRRIIGLIGPSNKDEYNLGLDYGECVDHDHNGGIVEIKCDREIPVCSGGTGPISDLNFPCVSK
jgi:chemotaxis protein histidine kinase CheA